MLSERARILLKSLVERHIYDGQPVGSRALARFSGLDLSPASIRNIMADLEEMGFIASPHTSAGRVPTPRGYRFFVDTLLTVKPLDSLEVNQLEWQLQPDSTQRLVSAASHMLSDLTRFAGVVKTPQLSGLAFRHIEFVSLSEKRLLLIIVTPEGDVQNRILHADRNYSESELTEAANFLNHHFTGLTFDEIKDRLKEQLNELRENMTRLMTLAVDAGNEAALGFDLGSNKERLLALERARDSGKRRRQRSGDRNQRHLCTVGRKQSAARTGFVLEHAKPAPFVRHVRAEDRPAPAPRHQ